MKSNHLLDNDQLILKFSMDTAVITKSKKQLYIVGFQIISHELPTCEAISPSNFHIFLIHQLDEENKMVYDELQKVLSPIKSDIEEIFNRKALIIDRKIIKQFKEVFWVIDMEE